MQAPAKIAHKPAHTGYEANLDRNTKGKVANQLASNVLANEDEEVYAQRAQWNNQTEKLHATGGQGWSG